MEEEGGKRWVWKGKRRRWGLGREKREGRKVVR